jgi:hypothetical protein
VSEAVAVAKEKEREGKGGIRTLSTGVRIRLHPVALGVWQDALKLLRGKEPKVPQFANPEKGGRLEENPNDPEYQASMRAYAEEQNRVSADVLLMFGCELVDGLPEDDGWIGRLKLLEKMGTLDLSGYDLKDPISLDFLYKKFVAVGPTDAGLIGQGWGPTEEEVAEAADFFPDSEARSTD